MLNERIKYLFDRCMKESCTPEELKELSNFLYLNENDPAVSQLVNEAFLLNKEYSVSGETAHGILQSIYQAEERSQNVGRIVHRVHLLKTAWFRSVAAILLILGVAVYAFIIKGNKEKPIIVAVEQNKQPGSDKAILTLSDGRQIILDSANAENIADGSVTIQKENGVVIYHVGLASGTTTAYNTMATPRGGQYQLVLPDGSKVWLNSASSIKYPTVFQGKNRIIELSGEAYFDIKQNKKLPFIVKTQKADILVLGTAFNVNSYSDEPEFSTTLINGSVKVLSGSNSKIISPGQQAQLLNSNPDDLSINDNVDVNKVVAWQKGIFEFDGTTLDVIARQLSRWYDIEVKAVNDKKKKLSGGITKKTPLKAVLDNLEASGVFHKWENNVITLYIN
jgi:transmembrane sensor